jgi:hypothetical protein
MEDNRTARSKVIWATRLEVQSTSAEPFAHDQSACYGVRPLSRRLKKDGKSCRNLRLAMLEPGPARSSRHPNPAATMTPGALAGNEVQMIAAGVDERGLGGECAQVLSSLAAN